MSRLGYAQSQEGAQVQTWQRLQREDCFLSSAVLLLRAGLHAMNCDPQEALFAPNIRQITLMTLRTMQVPSKSDVFELPYIPSE